MTDRKVEFGYNPPSGTRGVEQFPPETFVRDLQNALDITSLALLLFLGLRPSGDRGAIRMEGWTQLARIAAATRPRWWDHHPGEFVPTTVSHGKHGCQLAGIQPGPTDPRVRRRLGPGNEGST